MAKPVKDDRLYCTECDGTGWYEGGQALRTICTQCKGCGVVCCSCSLPLPTGRVCRHCQEKRKPLSEPLTEIEKAELLKVVRENLSGVDIVRLRRLMFEVDVLKLKKK